MSTEPCIDDSPLRVFSTVSTYMGREGGTYFSWYAATKGNVRPTARYPTVATAEGALNKANNIVPDRTANMSRLRDFRAFAIE